jgi:hypothetical protein
MEREGVGSDEGRVCVNCDLGDWRRYEYMRVDTKALGMGEDRG